MAQAPAPSALSAPPPGGAAGGMMPPDASAGAGAGDGSDSDSSDVIVTICKNDDGSYTVYAGDEPDAGDSGDMSLDDTDAMGSAGDATAGGRAGMAGGGAPPPQGQPADSIGAALKAALDILNADKSSEGAPGNADDQLAAGFSASQSPTPATGPSQKY
jgi:hypothetical protein